MRKKVLSIAVAVTLITASVSMSFAALLGVVPGLPNMTYDSSGTTTYNATSDSMTLVASPLAIVFPLPYLPIPRLVTPTGMPPAEVVSIGASISDTGVVLSGIPGDDLVIQGQVNADGIGGPDFTGILLTGEIIAFGFENTSPIAGGIDRYDFRFAVTGGSMASFFAGQDIGVTVTSENSDFNDDFTLNFNGGAKGNVGPIPRLNQPPVCSANGPYHAECTNGTTTIQLDGSQSSDPDPNTTLTYSWTTDCPGGSFDDPTSSTPILSIDTSTGCDAEWACTVTLSVSDGVSDPQTCQAQVTVSDSNNPTITCPADATAECDGDITPAATGTATASDDCDPAPAVTSSDAETPGTCEQEKTITRTWTATDRCGNTATCTQTINVVDTTAPIITACPPNRNVTCAQGTNPSVTGTPTATDNCDTTPNYDFDDVSVDGCCPTIAVITRTWTVSDDCGNTATCVQTITVSDTTAPTITCPPNRTIQCGQSKHPNHTGYATATDSCDPHPTITYWDQSCGECPRVISRRWKATDNCGRTSTCIQTITIVDTTPPTICCPPNKTVHCGDSTDPCQTGQATANDNCDDCLQIWYTDNNNGCGCPRTIIRTWKAKDDCNNIASCTQTITVQEDEPCPRSPGYWKNHQNRWPVNQMVVGDCQYNSTQLMRLLSNKLPNGNPANGDASANLAKFLIASTFNILNGAHVPTSVDNDIGDAHEFLEDRPPGSHPTGGARNYANQLAGRLDCYVNSEPNGCDEDGGDDHNRCGCYNNHRHRRSCQD